MPISRIRQAGRFLRLECPNLEKDTFLVDNLRIREGLSEPFLIELELISEVPHPPLKELIGLGFTITVDRGTGTADSKRSLHGIVRRLQKTASGSRGSRYQAELVPWLWFLSQTADCRIFQKRTVPEIAEEIFREFEFLDFEFRLQGSYEPWDYCVQYRETALNFVSRLFEQEGIYYYFEHSENNHKLVIVDSFSRHSTLANAPTLRFHSDSSLGGDHLHVFDWQQDCEFRPGKYSLKDYNFEKPANSLKSDVNALQKMKRAGMLELFDFPGEFEDGRGADHWTKIRMEEQEASMWIARGRAECIALQPGYRFDLERHPQADQNQNYLLTSVVQQACNNLPYSLLGIPPEADGEDRQSRYENAFTCIPRTVQYRPARITPKPFVQGSQTAVVTGPKGEEIWTDQHGRVTVQFHWDRRGKKDQKSSCWIRVSQNWAGPGWGAVFLPRIGQEVIVDFIEGDPDRPIITGRVYNAHQTHPYPLPEQKNVSGIKSNSTKGGDGFNEFSFDDTKGSERIVMHAQKDLASVVENNEGRLVKNDRATEIGNNETLSVGNNRDTRIGNNDTTVVTNASVLKADTILLDAGTSITLQCGASRIHMNQAGVITITGTLITMAGAANVNVAAPVTTITGAAMATLAGAITVIQGGVTHVRAAGTMNIQGSPVKINC